MYKFLASNFSSIFIEISQMFAVFNFCFNCIYLCTFLLVLKIHFLNHNKLTRFFKDAPINDNLPFIFSFESVKFRSSLAYDYLDKFISPFDVFLVPNCLFIFQMILYIPHVLHVLNSFQYFHQQKLSPRNKIHKLPV